VGVNDVDVVVAGCSLESPPQAAKTNSIENTAADVRRTETSHTDSRSDSRPVPGDSPTSLPITGNMGGSSSVRLPAHMCRYVRVQTALDMCRYAWRSWSGC
jgi:hypothetical protein